MPTQVASEEAGPAGRRDRLVVCSRCRAPAVAVEVAAYVHTYRLECECAGGVPTYPAGRRFVAEWQPPGHAAGRSTP